MLIGVISYLVAPRRTKYSFLLRTRQSVRSTFPSFGPAVLRHEHPKGGRDQLFKSGRGVASRQAVLDSVRWAYIHLDASQHTHPILSA